MNPWREVTMIEDGEGVRGGEFWLLTLSCGHVVVHGKRKWCPGRDMFRPPRLAPLLAPHRKRCLHCALAEVRNA